MSLHEIKNWLHNPDRDYRTGLEIYNTYKANNKFDSFFNIESPSPDSMQFKMLVQRVGEILRKLEQNPALIKSDPTVKPIDGLKKKSGTTSPNRPRVTDNPLIEASKLPPDLQRKYLENKDLVREISLLHENLKQVPKGQKYDVQRRPIAQDIARLDDQRHDNWEAIDTWWKQNILTTDQQRAEFDAKRVTLKEAKALFNKIESLKINISREEKKIKSDPVLAKKLTPKINGWKEELAKLEAKVNEDK